MTEEKPRLRGKLSPLLITGLVVFFILALALYFYFDYQSSAGQPPLQTSASQVSISQPANGDALLAYQPLTVDASAIGPFPFLTMELWVNGELASVQTGPSEGKTPLSAAFAWLPQDPGAYSLVARAINDEGQTLTSEVVNVEVGENPDVAEGSIEHFADVPAVAPPLGGGGYSPPSGPGADESVGAGEPWQASPGGWIDSLGDDQPPQAPELVLESQADSCQADLLIHDLSDNEQGFALFVQVNGGSWFQLDTLAAQSQEDWIERSGVNLVGGTTTFYVTAFNGEGEAQSNLASVSKLPGDCNPSLIQETVQAVLLEGISLQNLSAPDRLYCYRALNGGLWVRWPASDFFYPDQQGLFSLNEVLQLVVEDVEGSAQVSNYSLLLECWGWYGDQLEHLGQLEHNAEQLVAAEAPVLGEALAADIGWQTLDGDFPGYYNLIGDVSAEYVGDDGFIAKYIMPPDMVAPAAFVTYEPDECTNHLPPDAQNLLGQILFCFPYAGFHGGFAEGDNPQPYLAWNFFKVCDDGYGWESEDGPCKSYDYWLQEANATGGKVGFYVHDYSDSGYQKWTVTAPHLTMFTIPPNGCEGARTFEVQMYYEHADGFTQYSPVSNPVTINCPKPVGDVLQMEFVFETLELANVDDDDGGTEDVEVYGYFQVMAPSSYAGDHNYLKMATWDKQNGDCSDDTGTGDNHRPSCPRILTDGSHNLYNIPLCPSTNYAGQSDWQCTYNYAPNAGIVYNYATNQNSLTVDVQDGDAITLWVVLWDWDDASGNDTVCWGYAEYDSKTIFEWDAMDGESFGFIGWGDVSTGSTCGVEGVIHVKN